LQLFTKRNLILLSRFLLIGLVSSILASFVVQYFYMGFNLENVHNFIFNIRTEVFILSCLVFFSLFLFLASLIGSAVLSGSFLTVFSLILGSTAYLKYQYRNEPLFPSELSMISELPFLVEMISTREIIFILGGLSAILFLIVLVYKNFSLRAKGSLTKRFQFMWRFPLFVLSLALIANIYRFNYPGNPLRQVYNQYTDFVTYNQDLNYARNGFVAGFLFNLGTEVMEKPTEYSRHTIEEIHEKYTELANEINRDRLLSESPANILFIMNESFADPSTIEGFSFNQDPIPYTRSLMDSTLSGQAFAQNIGGGTANSEFEALTSLSLEPLASRIYSPYVEAADELNDVPSLAKKANDQGMNATAIHPYNARLYKRTTVYDNLGFNDFIYDEHMTFNEKIGNSDYISDDSAYKEMIQRLNETDNLDFIHLVTMQNHMAYGHKYDDPLFETSGATEDAEGNGYLQDLYHSDQALEALIEEVDQHDEEIFIVFWGDHQPGIYSDDTISQNSRLTMRETPLFFYSNKRELSGDIGTISPIYFINYILEALDMMVSPFEAMLMELEAVLPGIYGGLYLEEGIDGPVSSRHELQVETIRLLNEFTLIQYDLFAGSNYSHDIGFYDLHTN